MSPQQLHSELTTFVQNRLDEDEYRTKLGQTITPCSSCGHAYQIEVAARLGSQGAGLYAGDPHGYLDTVPSSIMLRSNGVHRGDAPLRSAPAPPSGWIDRFEADWLSTGGVVLSFGIIAGMLWFLGVFAPSRPTVLPGQVVEQSDEDAVPRRVVPVNVLNQVARNLRALRRGQLEFGYKSESTEGLKEFFSAEKVSYAPEIPATRLPLKGGFVSAHGPAGTQIFAHWVYGDNRNLIVFFAIPASDLTDGSRFYLTADTRARLNAGEKLWEDFGDDGTICCYQRKGIVYAIASTLDKSDLRSSIPTL